MKTYPLELDVEPKNDRKFKLRFYKLISLRIYITNLSRVFFSKTKKLAIIVFIVFIISAIALTLILVLTLKKQSDEIFEDCLKGHEQYQLSSPSKLGKYKEAAVAADSVACSTVGKYYLFSK
jgi:hypothetical protein